MSYFECPYCRRKAGSYFDLGNSAYLFNTDKKCGHCLGRVKLNLNSYFAIFWVVIACFIVGIIVVSKVPESFSKYAFFIFISALLIGQISIPYFLSKCFHLKLFLPKDNVKEFVDKMPSLLKYDEKDMPKVNMNHVILVVIIFAVLIFVAIYTLQ